MSLIAKPTPAYNTLFAKIGLFAGACWFVSVGLIGPMILLFAEGGSFLDALSMIAFAMFTSIVIAATIGLLGVAIDLAQWVLARLNTKSVAPINDDPHQWPESGS